MIVDGYDPVNLFEMVPKLELEFEPELARLDELLDDDQLFNLVKADLLRRHPNSGRVGWHSTPVEVILRMLIVKRLYGWSYAQTERFVNDSIVLRQFRRLYLERSPEDTTLIRWANTIGSETVASLNERAVQLARSLKVTRGRKLRIDGTVVETNIHHPTDDTLISDGVRVIGRLLRGAKSFVEESVLSEHKGEPFRNRTRSAKRLAHKISKMASAQPGGEGRLAGGLREAAQSRKSHPKAGRTGPRSPRGVALRPEGRRRDLPLFRTARVGCWAGPAQGARRGAP
jgi:IS5 family transposase